MKNLLSSIIIDLSGFDFVNDEIPEGAKQAEIIGDGGKSIHNHGMYKKNFFKGQKLLIVMLYTYGMIDGENEGLSDEYIKKSKEVDTECIQSSIDYTGIEYEVVKNYEDAINKLISDYKRDYCNYYVCIKMSRRPYDELPNPDDDPYLLGQFIKVVNQFWKNGGGIGLFADNAPFNYQTNLLIETFFPESKFRVSGNHPGEKIIKGDNSGELEKKSTFNRKIQRSGNYKRINISCNLYSIYEGKTVSYFVEKPDDDDILYHGKNEDLTMIENPDLLKLFIPFSKDSDGGFNSAFYSSIDEKGDIIIDCSYTKFFLEMGTHGTPRYIQNIISWLGSPEKHYLKDGCKDGSEYRPKKVDINIDWNDKWQEFKARPIVDPKTLKTLFAVDYSGSITYTKHYFEKLKELRDDYYNSNRGDKFYIWGSDIHYLDEQERKWRNK